MIIELWLSLFLLFVIAALIVYYALTPTQRNLNQSQQKTNKAWYQESLAELAQQYDAGALTETQLEQEKIALQKTLATSAAPESELSFKRYPLLLIMIIILLAVSSAVLYWKLGASQELRQYYQAKAQEQKAAIEAKKLGSPQKVIDALKARLAANPNQPQGWYLLGRLYFSLNQFDDAVAAFEKAAQLAPSRADIAIQLAEASYLSSNKKMQQQTEARLQKALALSPQDPAALNLEALMAYHAGHYQKALGLWQSLLLEAPQGSESAVAIQAAINKVQAKLNQQGMAAGVSIPVSILITPALLDKVGSGDTLFVYAKAEKGPPMPLAIQRMAVPHFPHHVILSDADAMMSSLKLSAFEHVVIYARISKSGQALPQPGDLIGQSVVVNTEHVKPVLVKISQVVPT